MCHSHVWGSRHLLGHLQPPLGHKPVLDHSILFVLGVFDTPTPYLWTPPSIIKEYVLFTEGTYIGLVRNLLLFLLSILFILVCVIGEEPEICQISQSDPVCPTIVSIRSYDSRGLTSHDLPSLYLMYPPHFWEWTPPSYSLTGVMADDVLYLLNKPECSYDVWQLGIFFS